MLHNVYFPNFHFSKCRKTYHRVPYTRSLNGNDPPEFKNINLIDVTWAVLKWQQIKKKPISSQYKVSTQTPSGRARQSGGRVSDYVTYYWTAPKLNVYFYIRPCSQCIPQVKLGKRLSQIFEFSFFCWVMAFFDISAIYSILNFDSDNRHIGTWFFASRVKMSFWNSKKKCVHKKCLLTYFLGNIHFLADIWT